MTNEICCSNSHSIFPSFMKKNALLEANNGVFIFLFLFPFIQIPFLHVCGFFYLLLLFFFWQRDHLVNVLIHLSFYTYISQNMIHEQMLANKRNLHHFCWRWWFFLNALKIWFAQMGSFSCMDPVFCLFFLFVCVFRSCCHGLSHEAPLCAISIVTWNFYFAMVLSFAFVCTGAERGPCISQPRCKDNTSCTSRQR